MREGHYFCAECGNQFPENQLLRYGELRVCGTCKPVFFQRVKEGVPLRPTMVYAGFWIRAGAKILDSIILGVANFIIQFVFGAFGFGSFGMQPPSDDVPPVMFFVVMAMMVLAQLAIAVGYTTFFLGKYGATPGKMACSLKVVTSDGGPISYWRAFGRYFAEMLSAIILYIGYIMVAFDEEKRALHDRICDTRVIYKR